MEVISFIGGGNMASALISGLVRKGWSPGAIHVIEIDAAARARLERDLKVNVHADLRSGIAQGASVVLAVKPQQLQSIAKELAGVIGDRLVVTIAAGIRHGDLARWLGGHRRLVRAMPNTPALALAGLTGLYAPAEVSAEDRERAAGILGAAGTTLWVESEEQMDAVTAVSGSGPAYVFYFIEALEQAALELGFAGDAARRLALETFAGAVKLASESADSVATLRERVTSKGGTTERALAEMEAGKVRETIVRAVHAAAERSRELGDALGRDGLNKG